MAVLWERSAIPWVDGDQALSGAKAYFFDGGTTTPHTTYTDAALSIPHDHPVVANSMGIFPAIFLEDEVVYDFRIDDADDALIVAVPMVSAPTTTPPEFPDSETAPEFLFQTGDMKFAYRTSAPTGWVRANGRTIGAAASGATERANADCEDLFVHLWEEDTTLAVSGGRGGTSAGDWAANKQIALPDLRGRSLIGMDSMGNSAAGRVTDAQLGEDSDGLGSVGGASTHTLVTGELAAHNHTINVTDPGHFHLLVKDSSTGGSTPALTANNQIIKTSGTGDVAVVLSGTSDAVDVGKSQTKTTGITADSSNTGSGTAHNNMQPSMVAIALIKL